MLSLRSRRYRASTSASTLQTSKATEVLQALLERLAGTARPFQDGSYPTIEELATQIRQIHQHVAAAPPPCPPQDDFRHLGGFQTLLNVLRSFSGFYNPHKRSATERRAIFDLLHVVLATLSAAFRGHPGNRRYFRDRVEGGGWEALEQIIASIGVGGGDSDLWANCQLFGKLLSFAVDDQRLDELCRSVASWVNPDSPAEPPNGGHHKTDKSSEGASRGAPHTAQSLEAVEQRLGEIIGPNSVIQNAEIIRTVVAFWESIPRGKGVAVSPASMIVLTALSALASVSLFNLSALHGTGMLSSGGVTVTEGAMLHAIVEGGSTLRALPKALHAAAAGDLRALAAVLPKQIPDARDPDWLKSTYSQTMYLATSCDDGNFPWPGNYSVHGRYLAAGRYLQHIGDAAFAPFDRAVGVQYGETKICAPWPAAQRQAPLPKIPDVPALLLVGGDDDIAPLEGAREIAGRLPHSQIVVIPARGHGELRGGGDPSGQALQQFAASLPGA